MREVALRKAEVTRRLARARHIMSSATGSASRVDDKEKTVSVDHLIHEQSIIYKKS